MSTTLLIYCLAKTLNTHDLNHTDITDETRLANIAETVFTYEIKVRQNHVTMINTKM